MHSLKRKKKNSCIGSSSFTCMCFQLTFLISGTRVFKKLKLANFNNKKKKKKKVNALKDPLQGASSVNAFFARNKTLLIVQNKVRQSNSEMELHSNSIDHCTVPAKAMATPKSFT